MRSPSRLLLLLISTLNAFVYATDDDYDIAIRQVMSAYDLTGSAVAFYDGVSNCYWLYLSYHAVFTHLQTHPHCIVRSGQYRQLCTGIWQNL
jgi:hypothetical protein